MENSPLTAVHVVVDMLYDFIDGSLACNNSVKAVKKTIEYINSNPGQRVIYVCDSHPANHCSFVEQGGEWPPHCVQGTKGQLIHNLFYQRLNDPESLPFGGNVFKKGCSETKEQYSGFDAVNKDGLSVGDFIDKFYEDKEVEKSVVLSGIATEFCIKESSLDLLKNGYKVFVNKDALGYVTPEGHAGTLKILEDKGVIII
jgi:nicotinamidase-related amidase